MNIGQVSELSGYSQRMIRYLEEQGLLEPHRSDSNVRKFNDKDLSRILKIKRLKDLGFSYNEIKNLIDQDDVVLSHKGKELLTKHHADAHDLLNKIRELEAICFGQFGSSLLPEKATAGLSPKRTAYRIKKLEGVWSSIVSDYPNAKVDVVLWKASNFLEENKHLRNSVTEIYETFKQSSVMAVTRGQSFLPFISKVFEMNGLLLDASLLGTFPVSDLNEFFGKSEIVIEYRVSDTKSKLEFHALLPYQAIFIASGETGSSQLNRES